MSDTECKSSDPNAIPEGIFSGEEGIKAMLKLCAKAKSSPLFYFVANNCATYHGRTDKNDARQACESAETAAGLGCSEFNPYSSTTCRLQKPSGGGETPAPAGPKGRKPVRNNQCPTNAPANWCAWDGFPAGLDDKPYCAPQSKKRGYMFVSENCEVSWWHRTQATAEASCNELGKGTCYLFDCKQTYCSQSLPPPTRPSPGPSPSPGTVPGATPGGNQPAATPGGNQPAATPGGNTPGANPGGNSTGANPGQGAAAEGECDDSCPEWTEECNHGGYCETEGTQYLYISDTCNESMKFGKTRLEARTKCEAGGKYQCHQLDINREICAGGTLFGFPLWLVVVIVVSLLMCAACLGLIWWKQRKQQQQKNSRSRGRPQRNYPPPQKSRH
eukprot:GEMP01037344.1.p1 GENE.GEMP01037344.1~~GEMP01037344.1.p1  ORF type:complete len:388 (+),score=54.05 GEMP01037344.1:139-1302(+)